MPPTQNPQVPSGYPEQPAQPAQAGPPPSPQPGYAGYPQAVAPPAGTQPPAQPQPLRVVQPAAQDEPSPYDFFLDPAKTPKKKRLGGGMSNFTKILLGAGALLVVLGILAVILSASRSNTSSAGPSLLSVAQSQQEIIRVSTLGQAKVDSDSLKSFAATAISTATSAQQTLLTFSSKNGGNIDSNQLDLTKNSQTDTVLDAAESASTYDPTFRTTMQQLVAGYEAKAQQARDSATTQAARSLLDSDISNATLLGQMLSQQ